MKLEVLVVTMGRSDLSLAEKMNIRQDALIANQCGKWDFDEAQTQYGTVRMLSSDTVGVGTNRNLALALSQGDILLFADDDLVYYDDLREVIRAFEELPQADVIAFSLDQTKNGEIFRRYRHPVRRCHTWNCLKFGGCVLAVRREAYLRANLSFSRLFGGGCPYSSGEDSLFILDCIRKGLKFYSHSYVLGRTGKDESSWFTGYNKKYFYDKGALIAAAFPHTGFLMRWYFALHYRKKTDLSVLECVRLMRRGQKGFRTLETWQEEPAAVC